MTIIYEDYESNKNGRPINNKGRIIKTNNKRQIIFNKNGNPVLNNDNNFQLPKRISQDSSKNIKQHPKSGHFYSTITYKNSNGITEKFVYVSKNGIQIKDKDKDIYLNKITGDIISGNGKKYVLDPVTKTLRKNRNGYIFEDNSNQLPPRSSKQFNI
jgi:hypothetical protein